ncbi:hypothetical protein A8F94_20550 [Bacillus sp. FJAT-27225]|nr:hypothetical protein A8F94_20550 [Bacillus sp. FJAT-27225]
MNLFPLLFLLYAEIGGHCPLFLFLILTSVLFVLAYRRALFFVQRQRLAPRGRFGPSVEVKERLQFLAPHKSMLRKHNHRTKEKR